MVHERSWTGLEMLAGEATLECCKLGSMGDCGPSSDQNADRNADNKDQDGEVSVILSWDQGVWAMCVILLQKICLHVAHILRLYGRLRLLIKLAEEISGQPSVEAVAWVLLWAFSQLYIENPQPTAQLSD